MAMTCRRGVCVVLQFALVLAFGASARAQDDIAFRLQQLDALYKAGHRSSALGNAYHNIAYDLYKSGDAARAEQPARRALAIWEKAHGESSGAVANACNTLGAILDRLRQLAEAEQCVRRTLRIWEKEYGRDSGEAANALNTLVGIMRTRNLWSSAEEPARRVLRVWTAKHGPDADQVANASNTLADVLIKNTKCGEAEKLARNALRIWEKLRSPQVNNARNTLAGALGCLGRGDEAVREQQRVVEASARDGDTGPSINNMAWLQLSAGRIDEAEKLFQKVLEIWSKTDTRIWKPSTAIPLSGLARTAMAQRDWPRAYDHVRRAVRISIERSRIESAQTDRTQASEAPSEIAGAEGNLQLLLKAAYQIALSDTSRHNALARETFDYAQWRFGSRAAAALAAMASRAAVEPRLAEVLRQRQDLTARWKEIDKLMQAEIGKQQSARNAKAEQALLDKAAAIERELGAIDKKLGDGFANYMGLSRVEPLSVDQTQALLGAREALILILPTANEPPLPEETFIWVVTKTEVRWLQAPIGTSALQREIAVLRCGLDGSAAFRAASSQCSELWKDGYSDSDRKSGKPPPFDAARAHALYRTLLSGAEPLIRSKDLLIVPFGPLTSMPFHVLVTKEPEPAATKHSDYRNVAWLAREHAHMVLPAVSSLQALRRNARSSAAPNLFIGFGNPELKGRRGAAGPVGETCDQVKTIAAISGLEVAAPRLLGAANTIEDVRQLEPVPETGRLLCDIVERLGGPGTEIHLGAHAREAVVKDKSANGTLARHRIVHFATHGLVAGELSTLDEPAIVLTPPPPGTSDRQTLNKDDGLLKASEIAGLKLDADWVILSACNTALGDNMNAESLSGLARAFFYAGARALLVSHWSVNAEAAVKLTTSAFDVMTANRAVGRAEALRRSMMTLAQDSPRQSHPSYWAPFVVVGEGGARQ